MTPLESIAAALARPDAYPEDPSAGEGVETVQTHISWVFLTRERVYKLRITTHDDGQHTIEDCYRFPSTLGDMDLYLLGEGSDKKIYQKLQRYEDDKRFLFDLFIKD